MRSGPFVFAAAGAERSGVLVATARAGAACEGLGAPLARRPPGGSLTRRSGCSHIHVLAGAHATCPQAFARRAGSHRIAPRPEPCITTAVAARCTKRGSGHVARPSARAWMPEQAERRVSEPPGGRRTNGGPPAPACVPTRFVHLRSVPAPLRFRGAACECVQRCSSPGSWMSTGAAVSGRFTRPRAVSAARKRSCRPSGSGLCRK